MMSVVFVLWPQTTPSISERRRRAEDQPATSFAYGTVGKWTCLASAHPLWPFSREFDARYPLQDITINAKDVSGTG